MTTPDWNNVDVPRDNYGRPMLIPAGGGTKRVPYRRTTTFVGVLEDQFNLNQWGRRQVALGLGQRKDLVLAAAAANPTDKKTLNEICEQALEAAASGAAATTGTALHSFTERIDRGEPLGHVPAEYQADLEAYKRATEGIEWVGIETFRVHDELMVAGTADRIGRLEWKERLVIADVKTGGIEFGVGKMAMQLALYARMTPYDIATDTRAADPGEIDLNTGIIIHLPAGQGICNLYEIDIAKGWGHVLIAKKVWDARGNSTAKKLLHPLAPPPKPATWESLTNSADNIERLRELWKRADELDQLTPDLKLLMTMRAGQLTLKDAS
jgi:hypothetical protein